MDFLRQLFLSGDFQPHGFCCQPSSGLVWLNVLSDAFIALAYFTILFALRWLIRKHRGLSFRWKFLGLALFMVASLEAQTTSMVEGIVTDQQGLAVAGAAIQIGNPLTGIDRGALLETATSSTGATILPVEIDQMPINGRNYLNLLQLVPSTNSTAPAFGAVLQVLPGREGQAGLRIEF
jgi:hypothetical protein